MGRDKSAIEVEGRPLLARTLAAAADAVGPESVARIIGTPAAPDSATLGRWLPDLRPDQGPLGGLETALKTADGAEIVLVAGVDHPWLEPAVLALLVDTLVAAPDEVDAVVLGTVAGPQLLLGAYRPAALARVSALLDRGERRLHALLDELHVEVVALERWRPLDPLGATTIDVDDPATLADTIRWHRRAVATAPRSAARATPDRLIAPERTVLRVHRDRLETRIDTLIGEEPLEIRAAGPDQEPVALATTLRTPGHEAELAVGWVLAEGLATTDDVVGVETGDPIALARPEDTVTVRVRHLVDANTLVHRHVIATASCGVCGRATIEELAARVAPVDDDAFRTQPLPWTQVTRLPDELRLAQRSFRSTGGVHAAGLFDAGGRLVTLREDVGRHNALDAAIGAHALAGVWPDTGGLRDLVCVLSGRVGFELVAKAAAARIPIVVAVGAASDLAVRTAERLQVTLVGFLRHGEGTVYTHPSRLVLPGHDALAR